MEVKYTLKNEKHTSNFANAKQAGRFIIKAAEKWKDDFKAEPITSGISDIGGQMPDKIQTVSPRVAGFNFFFPGQALREFYPEIQHEIVDYPNATNAPMDADITGDPHEAPGFVTAALDRAFDEMTKLGYISTSPAGAAGLGRDFKPQVLEGDQFRKEDEIRGGMFNEEFYQNYGNFPEGDALSVLAADMDRSENKTAAMGNAKPTFSSFLKRVMAEVAAAFISSYKLTSRPPLDKIPGTGEVQLDQIEQQQTQGIGTMLNITGSRVKALVEKLTDSDLQDCLNDSWAQAAVWVSSPSGGMVYECFVRAETLDSESLKLKYKFVTGFRDSSI